MISGRVNASLEAIVLVALIDANGDRHEVEAVSIPGSAAR
jgi:hypothetical protein